MKQIDSVAVLFHSPWAPPHRAARLDFIEVVANVIGAHDSGRPPTLVALLFTAESNDLVAMRLRPRGDTDASFEIVDPIHNFRFLRFQL